MDSIYEPKTMMGIVEMMPKASTFLINTFFKDQTPSITEKAVIDFKKGSRIIAPFVHPKAGHRIIPNEGYSTKEFTTPLLAPAKVIDAERLKARVPGENPFNSGISPAKRAVQYIANDMREMETAIARRKEWMAAQAIFGGKIPVVGENLNYEIDFDFTNSETLSAAALWSNKASDPSADMRRWKLAVQKKSGRNANIAVVAEDVMNAYINHPKIKERMDIRNFMVGMVAPRITDESVTYFATDAIAGVDIYCYNATAYDDFTDPADPKDIPLVPDGAIALLPMNGDFRVFYGSITMIPGGSQSFVTVSEQLVPNTFIKHNPDRKFLELSSRPLPAPVEVDSWYVAKVL